MQVFIQKKLFVFMFLLLAFFAVAPIRVHAITISDSFNILDDLDGAMDNYNKEQTCDGDNSLLGNVNDPNSVAWLLQYVFNVVKVVGPILVIILSSFDFAKVIISNDDESMAKAQKKLIWRLILVVALFLIPDIISVLLETFNLTSSSTCGIH